MKYRIVSKDDSMYEKLSIVADELTRQSRSKSKYVVRDTILDFGKGIMWTTVCCEGKWGYVQMLTRDDWDNIMSAEDNRDLTNCVTDILVANNFNI